MTRQEKLNVLLTIGLPAIAMGLLSLSLEKSFVTGALIGGVAGLAYGFIAGYFQEAN